MALLWTSPDDVRGRWVGGDPLTAEDAQIETLLEDAEDTVLREFPNLPDRIDAPALVEGSIPLLRVRKVIARIVIRHLRNPSGQRQRTDMGGPFSQSVTFGGDEPGALYLTDDDRAELGGTLTGAAFTIDQTPTTEFPTRPEAWLALGQTWLP